jgi:hypothetical protein
VLYRRKLKSRFQLVVLSLLCREFPESISLGWRHAVRRWEAYAASVALLAAQAEDSAEKGRTSNFHGRWRCKKAAV